MYAAARQGLVCALLLSAGLGWCCAGKGRLRHSCNAGKWVTRAGEKDLQNFEAVVGCGATHVNGSVKAAWPDEGIIQRIYPVGGSNH